MRKKYLVVFDKAKMLYFHSQQAPRNSVKADYGLRLHKQNFR
jgi:hypothetical protein